MFIGRALLKKALHPIFVKHNLYHQRELMQSFGLKGYFQYQLLLLHSALNDSLNRNKYRLLNEPQLRATRKSDTVFIFGSGYSLNDITPEQWTQIKRHDTLGFSGFVFQKFIDADYLLIRGWGEGANLDVDWSVRAKEFTELLESNQHFKNSILILQGDYQAYFCNTLIGRKILPTQRRIFRYKTAKIDPLDPKYGLPGSSFDEGLRHAMGILCDTVNFAFCLGWKHIVLAGVDLYDSRYFWLGPDETYSMNYKTGKMEVSKVTNRGGRYDQPHQNVKNGLIPLMKDWSDFFKKHGVRISVYNPRSLLSEVLPIHTH